MLSAPPRSGKTVCSGPGPKPGEPAPACRGAEYVSWEGAGGSGEPATSWGGHQSAEQADSLGIGLEAVLS